MCIHYHLIVLFLKNASLSERVIQAKVTACSTAIKHSQTRKNTKTKQQTALYDYI